jgi:hypothetical protein
VAGQRANSAPYQEGEPSRLFLAASYFVLFIGGGVLGAFGALLLPYSVSSGTSTATPSGGGSGAAHVIAAGSGSGSGIGQILSLGLLFALIANPALGFAGLWTAGTRLAAFTPLAGWLLVVLPMAAGTSDGDLILPSGLRSIAYLLVGALAFTAVATLGRPTRGLSAGIGQPLPRAPAAKALPAKSSVRGAAPKGGWRR